MHVLLWVSSLSAPDSVIGGLLGTQLGRDIEIMNTFELVYQDEGLQLDHGYFVTRAEQCQSLRCLACTYSHHRTYPVACYQSNKSFLRSTS